MAWRSVGTLTLFAAFGLAPRLAYAQQAESPERTKARELGYAGVHAYQAGDYVAANDALSRAYQTLPVPSLGLWSARALLRVGKLVEAHDRYREVVNLPVSGGNVSVQRQAQAEAQAELAPLERRIPRVRLLVQGAPAADVVVVVDDRPVPSSELARARLVNPGPHRVVARRGEQRIEVAFDAVEASERDVALNFAAGVPREGAAPSSSSSSHVSSGARRARTLAWVGLGLGGAGLAFGTVSGLVALAKKSSLEDTGNCWEHHCTPSENEGVASYNSWRRLSTAGFVAGGVFAATGVVLLVATKKSAEETPGLRARQASLALRLQPSGALLSGRF